MGLARKERMHDGMRAHYVKASETSPNPEGFAMAYGRTPG